jgi:hypothetical protein
MRLDIDLEREIAETRLETCERGDCLPGDVEGVAGKADSEVDCRDVGGVEG